MREPSTEAPGYFDLFDEMVGLRVSLAFLLVSLITGIHTITAQSTYMPVDWRVWAGIQLSAAGVWVMLTYREYTKARGVEG